MRPLRVRPLLAALLLLALAVSCSDDGPSDDDARAPSTPAVTDGFTLTRPDGSTVEVDGPFTVECLEGDGTDPQVVRASTAYYTGGARGTTEAYLELEPVTIPEQGITYDDLPFDGPQGTVDYDTRTVFFYDRDDELSAGAEGSTGTVRVVAATCDPEPRLAIEVDATLGSEHADGGTVEVVGGLDLTGE